MKVKCPRCKKETEYSPANKSRPFCSDRCATLDLGAWADEEYKVPLEDFSNETFTETDSEQVPAKHRLN